MEISLSKIDFSTSYWLFSDMSLLRHVVCQKYKVI